MIENKCNEWYQSDNCTVKHLIDYIEKTGQMRDAQIEAIKIYLFLKIKCENKPLAKLFYNGAFNTLDLNSLEISSSTREFLENHPHAAALYEYACLKNDAGEQVSAKVEKEIKQNPQNINYRQFLMVLFMAFHIPTICLAYLWEPEKHI